jgi:alpha-amylase
VLFNIFLSLTGYLPQNLYSLNSSYGSEHLLKNLLQKMKQYKVRAMADIVINHRVGTSQGHGGMYNRYDGIPIAWDERAVTSCTGGLVMIFILANIFSIWHDR